MLREEMQISKKEAENLIFDMTRYSDNTAMQNVTNDEIKQWFERNNISWNNLVQIARNPERRLPLVENLIGSDFIVTGEGSVTITVMHDGYGASKLSSSGLVSIRDYHSKYDKALDSRKNAIMRNDYNELLNCVTNAVASIESYINCKATLWNKRHSSIIFDVDNTSTLDVKLNDWLFTMTGKCLKNINPLWNHFTDYKNLNNSIFKHNTVGSRANSFYEMAKLLNKFKTGIATAHFELHRLFNERIPSSIIRGKYLPKVFVEK